jgi:hypothetical protein
MEVSDCCKVCAVPPRTLARGLKPRPRCIPGLISAEIRHRACFCRSARDRNQQGWSDTAGRRLALRRTAWGRILSPPLSFRTPPLIKGRLRSPLETPSSRGRLRSPPCTPIDQDFRVLHHDRCFGTGFDQGREILLSPWTDPSTNIAAVGLRPGTCIPDPAPDGAREARHGFERQR